MQKLQLCRYGGLSSTKQHHYTLDEDEMGFHGAPERYGFYSFLFPYIDWFLLGGDTGKMKRNFDFSVKHKKMDALLVPYKKFQVQGDIWTHIVPHPKYQQFVKAERGSWYKMDSNDFQRMYKKEFAQQVGEYLSMFNNGGFFGHLEVRADDKNLINYTVKSPWKFFSKDHLEIFVPHGTKII